MRFSVKSFSRSKFFIIAVCLLGIIPSANAAFYVPPVAPQQESLLTRFYFQSALQVYSQGGVDFSGDLFGQAYRINRSNLTYAITYAKYLESQNRFDETIQVYEEQLQQNRPDPLLNAELYYQISLLQDKKKDTAAAIKSMEHALMTYPTTPPARYYYDMGVLYAELDNYEQCKRYSQMAVNADAKLSPAWNNLGFSKAKLGDYKNALPDIQKSLLLDPTSPNALDTLGLVYYGLERYPEAIKAYEKALTVDPNLKDSYLYLGKSFEKLQDPKKALDAYEKFLVVAPADDAERLAVQGKVNSLKKEMNPEANKSGTLLPSEKVQSTEKPVALNGTQP